MFEVYNMSPYEKGMAIIDKEYEVNMMEAAYMEMLLDNKLALNKARAEYKVMTESTSECAIGDLTYLYLEAQKEVAANSESLLTKAKNAVLGWFIKSWNWIQKIFTKKNTPAYNAWMSSKQKFRVGFNSRKMADAAKSISQGVNALPDDIGSKNAGQVALDILKKAGIGLAVGTAGAITISEIGTAIQKFKMKDENYVATADAIWSDYGILSGAYHDIMKKVERISENAEKRKKEKEAAKTANDNQNGGEQSTNSQPDTPQNSNPATPQNNPAQPNANNTQGATQGATKESYENSSMNGSYFKEEENTNVQNPNQNTNPGNTNSDKETSYFLDALKSLGTFLRKPIDALNNLIDTLFKKFDRTGTFADVDESKNMTKDGAKQVEGETPEEQGSSKDTSEDHETNDEKKTDESTPPQETDKKTNDYEEDSELVTKCKQVVSSISGKRKNWIKAHRSVQAFSEELGDLIKQNAPEEKIKAAMDKLEKQIEDSEGVNLRKTKKGKWIVESPEDDIEGEAFTESEGFTEEDLDFLNNI